MFKKILLIVVILLTACSENYYVNEFNKNKIDSLQLKRIQNIDALTELFKVHKKIQLQTTPESLIGGIDDLIYLDSLNLIVIFDKENKEIFTFDNKGIFVNKIGRNGQGPEEYNNPRYIYYQDGCIYVYDDNNSLVKYNLKNEFIEKINYNKKNIQFIMDKIKIHNNNLYAVSVNPYYNYDKDKKSVAFIKYKNMVDYEKSFGDQIKDYSMEGGVYLDLDDKILYSDFLSGEIFEFNLKNEKIKLFSKIEFNNDLSELNKIKNEYEKALYWVDGKGKEDLDGILYSYRIKDFIFLQRMKMNKTFLFDILDINGNQHRVKVPFIIDEKDPILIALKQNTTSASSTGKIMYEYDSGFIIPTFSDKEKNLNNPQLLIIEMR